jgi:replicative DNA helicase
MGNMDRQAKSMENRAPCPPAIIPLSSGAIMADKQALKSEGEQLAEILDELQSDHAVKEIAGWESGFANLSRALDGIRPGLHLLIGLPGIGKTTFAKQVLDQIAMQNDAAGVFFSFAESKKELRIKTLARLSDLDSREIRRGSAYLLHWYGVPRLSGNEPGDISPSWEKLKLAAEQAQSWLDSIYLVECSANTAIASIAAQIDEIKSIKNRERLMVVIDDCQRLGEMNQSLDARLPIVVEQLQSLARNLELPLLAIWPDLSGEAKTEPHAWAERVASADIIMVMENDSTRTKQLTEPNQPITLHIVKNRGGEKGKLAFDFYPAFAKFAEAES